MIHIPEVHNLIVGVPHAPATLLDYGLIAVETVGAGNRVITDHVWGIRSKQEAYVHDGEWLSAKQYARLIHNYELNVAKFESDYPF